MYLIRMYLFADKNNIANTNIIMLVLKALVNNK